ncbi:UNVERIFIED_CONTAM: hypothetical protein PYX00_004172 [Menopon gallinae]|uniref:MYND-type domain-containing protein n=1 Tax=Menopon gallinae TaxID=328185 RepID=A0AAW2I462_9NEOP
MSALTGDILPPGEIELYVQHVAPTKLEELGSALWFESHHRLQKLYQQSIIEANEMREETVKDVIISLGKVPVLIHEAVCIQVWREKIFRQIIKTDQQPESTFIAYIILYHEMTAVGLLQNILYHKDSIGSLEDSVLDLIDYCSAEIIRLLAEDYTKPDKSSTEVSNLEEIQIQCKTIGFNIGLSAISILRYITEYKDDLTLSAVSRLYTTHDVPMLMTNLIQMAPWKRINHRTNIVQIYVDGTWKNIDKIQGIPKTEAQCWIALRYLLLDPKVGQQYEMTEFRKQSFVKVLKHLHETVIDQISPLIDLKQYLLQLSVTNVGNQCTKPLIMETIPEIKSKILSEGFKKWNKIAEKHINVIFNCSKGNMLEIAKRLGETYEIDHLERMAPEGPVCSNCGDAAAKRCSQCKAEWYCGRECQVKRWSMHKTVCNVQK